MPAASRAHPELIGRPGHPRRRIAHVHVGAAALTPDAEIDITHGSRFYNIRFVIPAIVLAAGRSTRMGRPKALLPLPNADTFLTRIIRTLAEAGVADVVVVVGHDHDAVVASLASSGLRARFVENAAYEEGQLTSIQAGLQVVDRPGVVAALVTLVDVPLVSARTVRAVVDCYRRTHATVVRPTSGPRHGHPLLLDRSMFDLLRHADLQAGAKPIVRAHASAAGDIAIDDEGAFSDVDTPAEYERLIRMFQAGGNHV